MALPEATEPALLAELVQPFEVISLDGSALRAAGLLGENGLSGSQDLTNLLGRLSDHRVALLFFECVDGRATRRETARGTTSLRDALLRLTGPGAPLSRARLLLIERGNELLTQIEGGALSGTLRLFETPQLAEAARGAKLAAARDLLATALNREDSLALLPIESEAGECALALPSTAPAETSRARGEALREALAAQGFLGGGGALLERARALLAKAGFGELRLTIDFARLSLHYYDLTDALSAAIGALRNGEERREGSCLIIANALGSLDGSQGSSSRLARALPSRCRLLSVGAEPFGVPPDVLHLGGGPWRISPLLRSVAEVHAGTRPRGEVRATFALPFERSGDPGWCVAAEVGDGHSERAIEALLSFGNGRYRTRAAISDDQLAASDPATYLSGHFASQSGASSVPELVAGPDWSALRLWVAGEPLALDSAHLLEGRRTLDLRQGVLWREWRHRDREGRITLMRSARALSLDDRRLAFQSVVLLPENYSARVKVEARIEPARLVVSGLPVRRPRFVPIEEGGASSSAKPLTALFALPLSSARLAFCSAAEMRAQRSTEFASRVERFGGQVKESWEFEVEQGQLYRLDRVLSIASSLDGTAPAVEAGTALSRIPPIESLAGRHREAWEARWSDATLSLEGDEEVERRVRAALFHLFAACEPGSPRATVGARALSSGSYRGHAFWEENLLLVPLLARLYPEGARALVAMRCAALDAARGRARERGRAGALFPWSFADSGEETSPRAMVGPDGVVHSLAVGEEAPVATGAVAWAVADYWRATGDDAFFARSGAELIAETARYWASRISRAAGKGARLGAASGLDQYHPGVEGSALLLMLAKWNLEFAAVAMDWLAATAPLHSSSMRRRLSLATEELERWRALAAALSLSIDEATGVVEAFDGYFQLAPFSAMNLRGNQSAVDLEFLPGRAELAGTQAVSQADVLMALYLFWERFEPRVRQATFDYYEPRSTHLHSTSPALHALLAAKLGRARLARHYLQRALRVDWLGEEGEQEQGLHAGAQAGLWFALAEGMAGLSLRSGAPRLSPNLPSGWSALRFSLRWRGARLRIELSEGREALLWSGAPKPLPKELARLDDFASEIEVQEGVH